MNIKGYVLSNPDKVERMLHGTLAREGKLSGGVGDEATDEAKLAEYDRLGGLILKDGHKVKTGSFYDFVARKPREKPEVLLVFKDLEGNTVELPEGKDLPLEVKAAEQIKAKKAKKAKKTIEDVEFFESLGDQKTWGLPRS